MCFGGGADDPGRERRNLSGQANLLYDEELQNQAGRKDQSANQTAFANQLADRALGKGASAVDMQMQAAQQRNLAQQLAMAKSNRSLNAGMANRQAQMNAAQTNQGIAQAGAAAKIQEQAYNQAQYNQYIQGQQQNFNNLVALRNQALSGSAQVQQNQQAHDDSLAGGLIGTAGQVGAAFLLSDKNQKKKIKSESKKLNSKKVENYELKAVSDEDEKTDIKKEPKEVMKEALINDLLTNKNNPYKGVGAFGVALMQKMQQPQTLAPAAAPMMGASPKFGNIMMNSVSDENEKSDKTLEPELSAPKNKKSKKSEENEDMNPKHFLDALQAYSYEYKNPDKPGAGKGRYLGVMAQDLEKAGPVGKSLVETQNDGSKVVNYGKGFGTILAAQAHLNERLKAIESKNKKKD